MTNDVLRQVDAFVTPGTILRSARQAQGLNEKEVAERLNWMPGYVAVIERDDYQALRRPAFARGYLKAYGKLLGVDEEELLAAFVQYEDVACELKRSSPRRPPRQLQHTGPGVVIGLVVLLLLLVAALWWWQGGVEELATQREGAGSEMEPQVIVEATGKVDDEK